MDGRDIPAENNRFITDEAFSRHFTHFQTIF